MMCEKKDLVFYFPVAEVQKYHEPHLGAAYIQAFLKTKGIISTQVLPANHAGPQIIARTILSKQPSLVGMTCYDSNYYYTKLVARQIKKLRPDMPIIVGGPTATFSSDFILRDCNDIDICVKGEGEETVYELIKWKHSSLPLSKILGISWRSSNGKMQSTPDRISYGNLNASLDELPSPYLEDISVKSSQRLFLVTSRGCPFQCTYCSSPSLGNHRIRYHSEERVLHELTYINKILKYKGVIVFGDESFTVNREKTLSLCKAINSKGLQLRLLCQTRAEYLDKELLIMMRQAGVFKIDVGLESTCPRTLQTIGKIRSSGHTNNSRKGQEFVLKVAEAVRLCKEVGIIPMVNIITGLPGETESEAKETIKFVQSLKLRTYSHNYLRIYKGTKLYETHRQYGINIAPSVTGLPMITRHSFDVSRVRPLENSIICNQMLDEQENLAAMVSGSWNITEKPLGNVIIWSDYLSMKRIHTVQEFMGINDRLIYYKEEHKMEEREFKEWQKICVDECLPTINFQKLNIYKGNMHYNINKTGWPSMNYRVVPFSNLFDNTFKKSFIHKVYWPSGCSDFNVLRRLVENVTYFTSLGQNPFVDPNCIVSEACRWGFGKCNATEENFIIFREGERYPCLSAARAKLSLSPNLESAWKNNWATRGCESCKVKKRCPSCLALGDIELSKYCNFMRQMSDKLDRLDNNEALLNYFHYYLISEESFSEKSADRIINCLHEVFDYEQKDLLAINLKDINAIANNSQLPDITKLNILESIRLFIKHRKGYSRCQAS